MAGSRDEGGTLDGESWTDVEALRPGQVEFAPVRQGMVLAERWVIEEILGKGGMGIVARAHDRTLGVTVAVKIVRAELAGERSWAERLAREVKLARQIQHANVCRVFELGQDAGRVFLVMELAKGTLRDELRARAAYAQRPLADRLADAQAVAAGLAAIHAAGIIHRDVSPQNLLRMADARLVVSDFGLATDDAEGTTSVHGGTMAYMAPELVRGGGRASVASDIWALGVVIHEIVFGEKPTWREAVGLGMSFPALGRPLTRQELTAVQICRACTTTEPARRDITAAEVERMLAEGTRPKWRRRQSVSRRLLPVGVGVALIVTLAVLGLLVFGARRSHLAPDSTAAERSPLIVASGEPTDWTDKSVVLAEVSERIHCTSLLPDQKTIRIVWGTPRRAEDVDTVTGRRVPSPLVPEAYAEGCPDMSPDGKRIVFTGYTPDRRPFAFVSEQSDGNHAVPVVPIAEPAMNSEPTWLADSRSFSFEADLKHMAAYSMSTKRAIVLPLATSKPFLGSLHRVVREHVFILAARSDGQGEVLGLSWPSVEEQVRFRFERLILDVESRDGHTYYCATPSYKYASRSLLAITPAERRAERVGMVRDQFIRYPRFVARGLTFVSIRGWDAVFARDSNGNWQPILDDGSIVQAVPCGGGIVVSRGLNGRQTIARLEAGSSVAVSDGPLDDFPACSRDGRLLFYVNRTSKSVIYRCDADGCRAFVAIEASDLAVSPDGERLAFIMVENRGPVVRWMSTRGGQIHDVVETETSCRPGWSSERTLWVSRRQGKEFVWTEVEADDGSPTGRRVSGSRDCFDGGSDPSSPVDPSVRMVTDRRSQLRLLPSSHLERPSGSLGKRDESR